MFEHWRRWFDIRGYVPAGALSFQDHVLLERRASGVRRKPLAARPGLPAPGQPESRVAGALAEAEAYRYGSLGSRSRHGALGALARRLVLRAIRPYTAHEEKFDEAVAESIAELTRASDRHDSRLRDLELHSTDHC